MKIGNLEIRGDLVLAPMAGVTDLAFRTICAELGATVTVTEMVSSRALIYQDKKSRSLLHRTPIGVCGAQIFGNDPSVMAEGAALALEASGADFIDINMGCPMPKIVNNGDGSALMKDPEKAARIVEAVCGAVDVPVTVKMRKGWDKGSCNAPVLAAMLEQAGAAAIAVHGRTKTMLYSGLADWDSIRAVREAVHIPVIANGDIFTAEDVRRPLGLLAGAGRAGREARAGAAAACRAGRDGAASVPSRGAGQGRTHRLSGGQKAFRVVSARGGAQRIL